MKIVIIFLILPTVRALIEEIPMTRDIQDCLDRSYAKGNLTRQVGEKVIWHCIHGNHWKRHGAGLTMPEEAMKWFSSLIHKDLSEAHHRRRSRRKAVRRQAIPPLRIRREYRMISDAERAQFHRALNMLKEDTSIPPNRFDALGRLHELLGERAHDGPNFLGWHRFFLVVAENALREKIPTVTIPYWDSTLDGNLKDPRASYIWSHEFMGNGNGVVKNGPLAGWTTPYGPLMRNFGDGGTMMNWTSIRDCFNRQHLAEILHPQAAPEANLEDHHGEPHLWIGGHMSPQALAGYDPIFLLHHSFIDLIWELFRRIQRRKGIDPTTDYPTTNTGPPGHRLTDSSGFGSLQNSHALSDIFTSEMYTYQLPPTCSLARPNCGSSYLDCDTSNGKPKCVAGSVFDTPPGEVFEIDRIAETFGKRKRRQVPGFANNDEHVNSYIQQLETATTIKCQPENVNDHYVNNYSIDGASDKRRWSFIPVSVIVKNVHITAGVNIAKAAIYPKCENDKTLPLNVYVESNGLNYRGFYKEVAHIPKDLAVSSTFTYIGIRSPTVNVSDVMISAYDSCGRICRVFCKSGPDLRHRQTGSSYHPCPGSIRVTQSWPLQYGNDVTTISQTLWNDDNFGNPNFREDLVFVKIVCGDGITWPWRK